VLAAPSVAVPSVTFKAVGNAKADGEFDRIGEKEKE